MGSAKQEALALIERLPDEVSMDMIMAELHFKSRLLRAMDQDERGDVISHEEARQRLSKWLDSSGQEKA
jgi:hypothetical protein